ncbi:MAG: indolepyruvate oxidoreductase subunit beta [Clostridiaceae bacterium]|nr:indolepyruvate oxidoreductase subunit beta [Clostridiaceae bacterium]
MNILIAAVGGQGALLASRILGKLAQNIGLDVKVSEVHGMSQRGGSVVTYVKFGDKIYSPIVEKGSADVILALEMLEGARYLDWLKKDGTLIVSTQRIDPMPVISGSTSYPDNLVAEISRLPIKLYSVDAVQLASKAGNVRATNVVLIGILASTTTIAKEEWEKAISEIVPQRLLEINLSAFELGYGIKASSSIL